MRAILILICVVSWSAPAGAVPTLSRGTLRPERAGAEEIRASLAGAEEPAAVEVIRPERLRSFKPEGVLFGFDRTLWQGVPRGFEAVQLTAWLTGRKLPESDPLVARVRRFLDATDGMSWAERRAAWPKDIPRGPEGRPEKVREEIDRYVKRNDLTESYFLTWGAHDLLEALKAGSIPMGIVTGGRAKTRKKYAADLGIRAFFGDRVYGDGNKKATIAQAAREWGITPDRIAVIGDGIPDLKAAQANGAVAVGFASSPEQRRKLIAAGADVVIRENFLAGERILNALNVRFAAPPRKEPLPAGARAAYDLEAAQAMIAQAAAEIGPFQVRFSRPEESPGSSRPVDLDAALQHPQAPPEEQVTISLGRDYGMTHSFLSDIPHHLFIRVEANNIPEYFRADTSGEMLPRLREALSSDFVVRILQEAAQPHSGAEESAEVQAELDELLNFLDDSLRFAMRPGRDELKSVRTEIKRWSQEFSRDAAPPLGPARRDLQRGRVKIAGVLKRELSHPEFGIYAQALEMEVIPEEARKDLKEVLKGLGDEAALSRLKRININSNPAEVQEMVSRIGPQLNRAWESIARLQERSTLSFKRPERIEPGRSRTQVLPSTLALIADRLDGVVFPGLKAGPGVSWAGLYKGSLASEQIKRVQPSLDFPIEGFIRWLNDGVPVSRARQSGPFPEGLQRIVEKRVFYAGPLIRDLMEARDRYSGSPAIPRNKIGQELKWIVSQYEEKLDKEKLEGSPFSAGDLLALARRTVRLLRFVSTAGAEESLQEMARSPDGEFLVTRWKTGTTVHLRHADTLLVAASLTRHQDPVTAVSFSPDNTLLATADSSGLVSLWALPSGELIVPSAGAEEGFSPEELAPLGSLADQVRAVWQAVEIYPGFSVKGRAMLAEAQQPILKLVRPPKGDRTPSPEKEERLAEALAAVWRTEISVIKAEIGYFSDQSYRHLPTKEQRQDFQWFPGVLSTLKPGDAEERTEQLLQRISREVGEAWQKLDRKGKVGPGEIALTEEISFPDASPAPAILQPAPKGEILMEIAVRLRRHMSQALNSDRATWNRLYNSLAGFQFEGKLVTDSFSMEQLIEWLSGVEVHEKEWDKRISEGEKIALRSRVHLAPMVIEELLKAGRDNAKQRGLLSKGVLQRVAALFPEEDGIVEPNTQAFVRRTAVLLSLSAAGAEESRPSDVRFLVADDSELIREFVRDYLGSFINSVAEGPLAEIKLPDQVVFAESPEEAEEKLQGLPQGPLVAVLDLQMGSASKTGLDLATQIRQQRPGALILMLSSTDPVNSSYAASIAKALSSGVLNQYLRETDLSRAFGEMRELVSAYLESQLKPAAGAEEEGLEEADEEPFGVVAVEGVVAAVPAWARAAVYGVTVGLSQTRAAVELGTVPPAQLIAVASGEEEAQAIAELGVPEVQVVETKEAGIRLAQGILETIGGFSQVRILDAAAGTLRELQWLRQLPAAWQGGLTAGIEEQVLQLEELSQVGV